MRFVSPLPPTPEVGSSRKLLLLSRLEGQKEKLMFPDPRGQGHLDGDGTRQGCLVTIEETQLGPESLSQRRE